jgi:hypothetical protein
MCLHNCLIKSVLGIYIACLSKLLYQGIGCFPECSAQVGIGAQVGGRYYFTDKFGVNVEIGGGNAFSGGKIGVSIKL